MSDNSNWSGLIFIPFKYQYVKTTTGISFSQNSLQYKQYKNGNIVNFVLAMPLKITNTSEVCNPEMWSSCWN